MAAGRAQAAWHGLAYVVGTAVQGLAVLAILPFITRGLGPVEYGRVAVSLAVVNVVSNVLAAGLPQVILREHYRGAEGPRRARVLAGTLIALAVGAGVVVDGTLTLAGAFGVGSWGGSGRLALWASIALAGVISGQAVLRAARRPLGFLVLAVGSTFGAQVAGLSAISVRPTAVSFLSAYVAALALAALIGVAMARPLPPWSDTAAARSGLAVSLPLLPHGLAMLVLLMGDTILVERTLGVDQAGRYQVALTLGNIAFVFASALFNAWSPLVMGAPAAQRWTFAGSSGGIVLRLTAAVSLGVAAVSPIALVVLAPESFDRPALVPVAAILAMTAPAYVIYLGSSLVLVDTGRTQRLARDAVICAVGFVLVALVAVTGVMSMAAAKVGAYVALAAVVTWSARRVAPDLRWSPRLIGAVAAMAVGVVLVLGSVDSGAGAWVARGAVLVLAAGLALSALPGLRALGGGPAAAEDVPADGTTPTNGTDTNESTPTPGTAANGADAANGTANGTANGNGGAAAPADPTV